MNSNCLNYTEPGGNKTVIGGTLEVKEGATVTGLTVVPLTPATAAALGGVKVGGGLSVTEAGVLSVAPATAAALGSVKVGGGLSVTEAGVLSVAPATSVADSDAEELADLVTAFNGLLAALRTAGFIAQSE